MAQSGMKGLQAWCKQITTGYRDVNITNMTKSWRDGLAFCAIIHYYRPDLIDFDSLSKENIAENNRIAFTVGEALSIPALLDVEDMVAMAVPDKLSIMTYVSQYYNYFRDKQPGGGIAARTTTKRPSSTPVATPTSKKIATSAAPAALPAKDKVANGRQEHPCHACGKPVYLMERLTAEGKLYHRLCLKCSVCGVRLKGGSYRYKTNEGKFYCVRDYEDSSKTSDADGTINGKQHELMKVSTNGTGSDLPETKPTQSAAQSARERFLSDDTSTGGSSVGASNVRSGQERSEAASFLSGMISNATTDNSSMQKQISAPAGYPSSVAGKKPGDSDRGLPKLSDSTAPSTAKSKPSALPSLAEASNETPAAVAAPKQKKLVLKVKKKRKEALPPKLEESPGKDYASTRSDVPGAHTKATVPTTNDIMQNKQTGDNKLSEVSRHPHGKSDVLKTSSSGPPPRPPVGPSVIANEVIKPPSSAVGLLPGKEITKDDQGSRKIDEPKDAKQDVPPQRPPPRDPVQSKTTKRRAPARPSKTPYPVTPRFVGPRAPRESKEAKRGVALRDKQLSMEDIAAELRLNEARQADMERRGVRMEKKLRAQSKGEPEEEYLIEWFALVNDKNKLLRRENELIYMAQEIDFLQRQQNVECELRALLEKSDHTKSNKDRKREEQLLQEMLGFVSKRDQIVGKLEEDRKREIEEDKVIAIVMAEQGLTRKTKYASSSKFF